MVSACTTATGAQLTAPTPSSSASSAGPPPPQYVSSMHEMTVGKLVRTWDVLSPRTPLPRTAPIVVVLSGISAPLNKEIPRDNLVPAVANGDAELVYPVGYQLSWNAGGCCGKAGKKGIDDLAFMRALVARLNPRGRHPMDVVGYSNGGRLAYRIACTYPRLFDQIAVVKAMPMPGCVVTRPVTLIQVDGTNDPAVPLMPGDHGEETPPATVEITRLRAVAECQATAAATTEGGLQLSTWSCRRGTRIAFALYHGGGHSFPQGDKLTPSAGSLIWAFFTRGSLPGPT